MKDPWRCALAICLFGPLIALTQSRGQGLDVSVRSGIDRAEQAKREKDPAYAHDNSKRKRLYFLAHIQEEKNGRNLMHPVNANVLARQLNEVLASQGFHAVASGQTPDIVITVKYGRGVPPNVLSGFREPGRPVMSDSGTNGFIPNQKKFVGREERIQRVRNQEKLIIEVRAWEYPPPRDPKEKEKLMWLTTAYIDDPDHRDLNEISAQMLSQAAPYFDHHIDRESEIQIHNLPPEGHVKVGSPEVVPDSKPQ